MLYSASWSVKQDVASAMMQEWRTDRPEALPSFQAQIPRLAHSGPALLPFIAQITILASEESRWAPGVGRLCPLHLLDDILWAVSEPLESARLDQPPANTPDLNASPEERDAAESVLSQLAPKVLALPSAAHTCCCHSSDLCRYRRVKEGSEESLEGTEAGRGFLLLPFSTVAVTA